MGDNILGYDGCGTVGLNDGGYVTITLVKVAQVR